MYAVPSHRHLSPRSGFSLVELLVVMAILAMLCALAYGVLGTAAGRARVAATQATLKNLDAQIRQKTEAFRTASFSKEVDRFVSQFNAANGANPITIQERRAVEILVRKNAFKSMFPQREEDLWGFDGVEDTPTVWATGGGDDAPLRRQMYDTMGGLKAGSWKSQNGYPNGMPAGTPPDGVTTAAIEKAESSELLYLALTKGDAYGLMPVSLDSLPPRAIGDTDQDGNPEILDDWGEPVQFYNWPTQLMQNAVMAKLLIPALPGDVSRDPDDPLKVLSGPTMSRARFTNDYNMTVAGTANPKKGFSATFYHDWDSYHTPLAISAGPDRILGIHPPNSTGQQRLCQIVTDADVNDNISTRQGR